MSATKIASFNLPSTPEVRYYLYLTLDLRHRYLPLHQGPASPPRSQSSARSGPATRAAFLPLEERIDVLECDIQYKNILIESITYSLALAHKKIESLNLIGGRMETVREVLMFEIAELNTEVTTLRRSVASLQDDSEALKAEYKALKQECKALKEHVIRRDRQFEALVRYDVRRDQEFELVKQEGKNIKQEFELVKQECKDLKQERKALKKRDIRRDQQLEALIEYGARRDREVQVALDEMRRAQGGRD